MTMPPKAQPKLNSRKDEGDAIPIVDKDTLALTLIELFSDVHVAANLKKALYPQARSSVKPGDGADDCIKHRDETIKKLEGKVAKLEFEAVKLNNIPVMQTYDSVAYQKLSLRTQLTNC